MSAQTGVRKPVLGIDLGGTKIAGAIVSAGLEVIARDYTQTRAEEGPQPVIERIAAVISRLVDAAGMRPGELGSIGIAAAGVVDISRGLVVTSPNLPGWTDVPLAEIFGERFGTGVFVVNDANAAALGEHRLGAGRGTRNMVYLSLGTGIGGGIIAGGCLYQGRDGCAAELGHMTVDVGGPVCNCGRDGCLEALASGSAIAREARQRLDNGEASGLPEMAGGDTGAVTAELVTRAAREGDRLALEVMERAAFFLGVGLVNLIHIFNPEMIVVGGGLSRAGDLLLGPARRVVAERAFPSCGRGLSIVPARLGDDAGVLGAAVCAAEIDGTEGNEK